MGLFRKRHINYNEDASIKEQKKAKRRKRFRLGLIASIFLVGLAMVGLAGEQLGYKSSLSSSKTSQTVGNADISFNAYNDYQRIYDENTKSIIIDYNNEMYLVPNGFAPYVEDSAYKKIYSAKSSDEKEGKPWTNRVINGQSIMRDTGNYTRGNKYFDAIDKNKPTDWNNWGREQWYQINNNIYWVSGIRTDEYFTKESKDGGRVDYAGWTFWFDGDFRKQSSFLNSWKYRLLSHNGQQAWNAASFASLKEDVWSDGGDDHDDNRMKYKDFIWCDVINGERLNPEGEWTQDKTKNDLMNKFYSTPYNTGLDQEVEWKKFLDTPFAFQPVAKWSSDPKLQYLNYNYNSDYWHGNINSWRASAWGGAHHNWKNIPQMKNAIMPAYDFEFKQALKKSISGSIEGRVDKLYVWIPYWLKSGDDVRSFDFSETAIIPLEASWNFYDKNTREADVKQISDEVSAQYNDYRNITIETDDGVKELYAPIKEGEQKPNTVSTIDKFNNILNEIWSKVCQIQQPNINKWIDVGNDNNGLLVLKTGANTYNLYLKVKPGVNTSDSRTQALLLLKGLRVNFEPSAEWIQWYGSKSTGSRIKVDPSYYFSYENGRYYYKKDVPVKDPDPEFASKPNLDYNGRWIYHSNSTITFDTTLEQDEILYINNKPVDVKDYQFVYNLRDEIVLDKDNNKVRQNEYQIKIEKYKQINGVNIKDQVLSKLVFDIVISSYANDFDISYFAWDPSSNWDQQQLISEWMLDPLTKEPLLDKDGNQIPNPKYNPFIDPKTGVIKQIVWVNKRVDNKYLKFLPDPFYANGNKAFQVSASGEAIIDPNNIGFIAEAFVIPKGINIQDLKNFFGGSGTKLYQGIVQAGDEAIIKWKEITYGSELNYLSKSGIYLFCDDVNGSLSTVKLVGYGGDTAFDFFTNRYVDTSENGWAPFWDTYHGLHLKNYLYDKGYDNEFINSLGYNEVIHHWKNYVSLFVSKILDPSNILINPSVNEKQIRDYAFQFNKADFNPDDATVRSWLNFVHSDLVNVSWTLLDDSNQLRFVFSKNGNISLDRYIISPETIFIDKLRFKDSPDDQQPEGTIKLNLVLDNDYINNVIANNTLDDYYLKQEKLFNKTLMFKKVEELIKNLNFNVDLVNAKGVDLVKFSFNVIDPSKYWLSPDDQIRYFDNKFSNDPNLINIFKNFTETEFNVKTLNGTVENIKNLIKKFVLEKVDPRFVLDKDYEIKYPSDQEILKISIMRDQTFANPEYIVVGLRILPTIQPNCYGYKDLIVYNWSKYIPNVPDNDLSKIKLNDLEYFINDPDSLKQAIIKDLNNQLLQYKLVLFDSVDIVDFDTIIDSFFIRIGKKTITMKIISLIDGINGYTTIRITNTTNKAFDFDLSKIKLDDLNIQLVKPNDIKNAIWDYLRINLYDKYGFEESDFNIYYLGNNNVKLDIYSLEFMRLLVKKNPPEWKISKRIIIVGKAENIKNRTHLVINNKSGSEPYDPDKDPDWLPEDQRPNGNGSGLSDQDVKTIVSSVFGFIAFILALGGILFGLRIWFRNQSKHIR